MPRTKNLLKADLPAAGPIKIHHSLLVSKVYVLMLHAIVYCILTGYLSNDLDPNEKIFNEHSYTSKYYTTSEFDTDFEDMSEVFYFLMNENFSGFT